MEPEGKFDSPILFHFSRAFLTEDGRPEMLKQMYQLYRQKYPISCYLHFYPMLVGAAKVSSSNFCSFR